MTERYCEKHGAVDADCWFQVTINGRATPNYCADCVAEMFDKHCCILTDAPMPPAGDVPFPRFEFPPFSRQDGRTSTRSGRSQSDAPFIEAAHYALVEPTSGRVESVVSIPFGNTPSDADNPTKLKAIRITRTSGLPDVQVGWRYRDGWFSSPEAEQGVKYVLHVPAADTDLSARSLHAYPYMGRGFAWDTLDPRTKPATSRAIPPMLDRATKALDDAGMLYADSALVRATPTVAHIAIEAALSFSDDEMVAVATAVSVERYKRQNDPGDTWSPFDETRFALLALRALLAKPDGAA